MSVNITKQGIVYADGTNIKDNIIGNSSGYNGTNSWSISTTSCVVEDCPYGKCFHMNSASSASARQYIYQGISSRMPTNNFGTYTLSFYYKATSSNTSSGVGGFIRVGNTASAYNDRLKSTGSLTLDNQWHYKTLTASFAEFNNTGVNNITAYLFAFKGDVWYANVKFELNSVPTIWTPSSVDTFMYVGDTCGFTELSIPDTAQVSIGSTVIKSPEFIEW